MPISSSTISNCTKKYALCTGCCAYYNNSIEEKIDLDVKYLKKRYDRCDIEQFINKRY